MGSISVVTIMKETPARTISDLDMQDAAAADHPTCPRPVAELLARELSGLEGRIQCLSQSRDTIREFLIRTEQAALLSEARAGEGESDAGIPTSLG